MTDTGDSAAAEHDLAEHDTAVLAPPPAGPPAAPAATVHRRWRWTGAIALLVVAALLTPPALVGFWGRRTITDAQRYLDTVGPLASSPEIQAAVATEVTDQLLSLVDINGFVTSNLPPQAAPLGPAITGAVQNFVQSSVQKFMASDQFDALWVRVNTQIQKDLVKALNGDDTGAVTVRDGVVYLNLSVVAEAVKQALIERGLTIFERVTIPPQAGKEIVLLTSPQLDAAQQVWTFTEPIARWMLPIVFLLYLAAILLAPNRRRMLLLSGLVIVAGMALLALTLSLARTKYADAVSDTGFSQALLLFYDTMIRYLVFSMGALAALGIFMAFFAWLGGPSAPAGWLRGVESKTTTALGETAGRWEPMVTVGAWVARGRTAIRAVITAVVVIAFIVHAQATWERVVWSVVIVVVVWVLVDVLAAAANGEPGAPAAEDEAAVPVDA